MFEVESVTPTSSNPVLPSPIQSPPPLMIFSKAGQPEEKF
jgi:hypothetical protein